jgi:chromosome segregation ATPase
MSITNIEQQEAIIDQMLKMIPAHVIARELSLEVSDVIDIIQGYREKFDEKVKSTPDLLDRKLEHVFKSLEAYDKVKQEAWKMYEGSDVDNGNVRAKFLKLVMEAESNRDSILQLLGTDKESSARLQLAQAAQGQFIGIVKQVVSGCPKCASALRQALNASRMSVVVEDHRPIPAAMIETISGTGTNG